MLFRSIDPLTGDYVDKALGVILLAHSARVTYSEQDKLYCKIESGSIVVDPWRSFTTDNANIRVIHYGNTRNV